MSADNFTGQFISSTFQRLLQLSDNGNGVTDGTGSLVSFLPINVNNALTASYVSGLTALNTSSFLINATVSSNVLTFTKGDGSTFNLTVDTGSGGTSGPESDPIFISMSASFATTGSNNFNGNQVITGSIFLTGSAAITGIKYTDFDITQDPTTITQQEGRLFWNTSTKTLQLDLDQNFHTDLNQQLIVRVVNPYNFTLPIGTVVYITGSQGNRPTIATASWTGDQTSAATLGITAKSINQNNNGYVITRGILDGLNTDGFSVGDQLYLSSNGQITNVPPDAPLHEVRVGKVLVASATNGSIYVDIMNGYELTELHDVRTTVYQNGDLLVRSGSVWTNSKQLTGSYVITGSLDVSGSFGLYANDLDPTDPPTRVGLFYFTNTNFYVSLQ